MKYLLLALLLSLVLLTGFCMVFGHEPTPDPEPPVTPYAEAYDA